MLCERHCHSRASDDSCKWAEDTLPTKLTSTSPRQGQPRIAWLAPMGVPVLPHLARCSGATLCSPTPWPGVEKGAEHSTAQQGKCGGEEKPDIQTLLHTSDLSFLHLCPLCPFSFLVQAVEGGRSRQLGSSRRASFAHLLNLKQLLQPALWLDQPCVKLSCWVVWRVPEPGGLCQICSRDPGLDVMQLKRSQPKECTAKVEELPLWAWDTGQNLPAFPLPGLAGGAPLCALHGV